MNNICKAFSFVDVLRNASFSLAEGEIHALMGENGAGKSTLMKILTGVYTRDSGEVLVDGVPVNYKHPTEAEKAGIVFIHQELNTMGELSVEENMFMCKEIRGPLGVLNKRAMARIAAETIAQLGISIDTGARMESLSVGQQQMVEIAKALMVDAKVLIMDEPTAALSPAETEVLFQVIQRLKQQGVSLVYISHRMEEIFEICERITILRDGETVGTRNIADTNMTEVIRMMIGRELGERFPARAAAAGDVMLEVEGLTLKGKFEDVSFSVRAGEVLGVAGLMGAGRTEIMQSIFGNLPRDKGTIKIQGEPVRIHSPQAAKRHGIGFITEDRKLEGLMLDDGIDRNIGLVNLERISAGNFVIRKKQEDQLVQEAVEKLHIKCSSSQQVCRELSGGNQQKVVFAKWIFTEPKILILDEPTRGVDVGAKKEIYSLINQLAENGVAIVFISSDLPEVLGMSDRIMAVHEGRISGFVDRASATQDNVMLLCTGVTESV